MKNMKRKIAFVSALFLALWTAQTALAWYDPSSGRWLTRDPIGEPGFQVLQAAQTTPQTRVVASSPTPTKWIRRDSQDNENRYLFVGNDPINLIDPVGLYFLPLPINDPVPDVPPDPKKTHLECFMCRRCTGGGAILMYNGCFMRRPNDTPMNKKAFEACMAPLVPQAQKACSAWDVPTMRSITRKSKICYDHHW